MAFAHSKLMGPSLRRDLLPTKTPALPLHQKSWPQLRPTISQSQVVTREGGRNSQAPKAAVSVSVSRRGAMLYMTAEILSGATAEPAEARVTKLERKREIMEKLEKLRERAFISKPKTGTTLRPQPLVEALLP